MNTEETGDMQKTLKRGKGTLCAYQIAVTGRASLGLLLLHELIQCCVTPIPGKAGSVLRSLFYPLVFKNFARSAVTGKDLSLYQPGKIRVAAHAIIEEGVSFNVKRRGVGITVGKAVHIGKFTILSCPGGQIIIEDGSVIGANCRLGSLLGLEIGKGCFIGRGSYVIGAAHAYKSVDIPITKQPLTCRGKTIIADEVRIGNNVTIRDGVTINKGARIGDGALVLRDVAEKTVVQGVPAVPVESI